jgi:glucosylceramidase
VLRQVLDPVEGIGMSLMRLCIGTSDFTGDPWYSYDDVPPGDTDPELARFSIDRDRACILPVIQEARRVSPKTLFFASAWSPPGWMKTTGSLIGGELQPRWYGVYARYLVRFIQAYEREGIPIHAITVQNEPGVDRAREKDPKWFYPSCHWTGEQERDFIRDHLGPSLRRAGLRTKIWCFDHNYTPEPGGDDNGLRHPRTILTDRGAARYVDGVAFHGYTGRAAWMSQFHREFPAKPVYFTEGSAFSVYGAVDIIERLRNEAASYNAWVIILDEKGQPNNGPFPASHAAIRLDSKSLREEYLFEFYNYGQFMKFIRPGAVRLGTAGEELVAPHVVFRNMDGTVVLVTANTEGHTRSLGIEYQGRWAAVPLPPKTVVTLRWK